MHTTHSKKGFTLLESLVAISILLIAVVGPMSIIGRSLPQSAYARDHAIAVNLAQEGIEAVRQKRDSNMLDKWNGGSALWDDGIGIGYYRVDPRSSPMLVYCDSTPCTPITGVEVLQDAAGWYYQSPTGTDPETKFTRYVWVSLSSEPHEKHVTSFVFWFDSMGEPQVYMVGEFISGINS